jgi:hypothetical protein
MECREWGKPHNNKGYPQGPKGSTGIAAHVWVWVQINGPIPKGLVVMHTCDNPSCILLAHLRLGTVADNKHDAGMKGRLAHSMPVEDREQIIDDLVHNRYSITELARLYGVGPNTIKRIKWTYIDGIPRDQHPYK